MDPITLSHKEFYKRVVQHIPRPHFRSFRYYGIYNPNHQYAGDYVPIEEDPDKELPECPECGKDMNCILLCSGIILYIDTNRLDIKDYLENSDRLEVGKDPPKKLRPPPDTGYSGKTTSGSPFRTEKNPDPDRNNSPSRNISDRKSFLEDIKSGQNKKSLLVKKYSKELIKHLKNEGEIYEPKPNTIKIS